MYTNMSEDIQNYLCVCVRVCVCARVCVCVVRVREKVSARPGADKPLTPPASHMTHTGTAEQNNKHTKTHTHTHTHA